MKKLFCILGILLLIPFLSTAQEIVEEQAQETTVPKPMGLIFNIGNVLDGVDSYQGGIGLKVLKDQVHWRYLLDLYYDYDSNLISVSLGAAREYHPYMNKISPYLGWDIGTGITYSKVETNDQMDISVPVNAAMIFGAEWYLAEFISLFAEYSLGVEYQFSFTSSSTSEDETSSSIILNTGMGNEGKIGVTIYLKDRKDLRPEQAEPEDTEPTEG